MGTLHPDGANDKDDPVDATDRPGAGDAGPIEDSEVDDLSLDPSPDEPGLERGERDEDHEEDGEVDPAVALTEQRRRALAKARRNGLPPRMESWRKRTATGAVLTGFALGFQQALGQEPPKAAIIMEAPGDPPTDLPVDAEVDQIRPSDNVVRIRPWLLADGEQDPAAENPVADPPLDEESAADDPGAVGSVEVPSVDHLSSPTDDEVVPHPDEIDEPSVSDQPKVAPTATAVPERPSALLRRRGRR